MQCIQCCILGCITGCACIHAEASNSYTSERQRVFQGSTAQQHGCLRATLLSDNCMHRGARYIHCTLHDYYINCEDTAVQQKLKSLTMFLISKNSSLFTKPCCPVVANFSDAYLRQWLCDNCCGGCTVCYSSNICCLYVLVENTTCVKGYGCADREISIFDDLGFRESETIYYIAQKRGVGLLLY